MRDVEHQGRSAGPKLGHRHANTGNVWRDASAAITARTRERVAHADHDTTEKKTDGLVLVHDGDDARLFETRYLYRRSSYWSRGLMTHGRTAPRADLRAMEGRDRLFGTGAECKAAYNPP